MWLPFLLIILGVLVLVLITLSTEERQKKAAKFLNGKLTGYWNGIERRASVRINTAFKTKYTVEETKPGQKREATSKNISLGGILLQLCEKLYPPTLLILDIFLPNEEVPIAAKGEVVWIKELSGLDELGRRAFDAGIKFVSMDPRDKERLDNQIKVHIKKKNG